MPRRKQTMRVRRIADWDVEDYREIIAAGKPWTQKGGELGGYFDAVYGLISVTFTVRFALLP